MMILPQSLIGKFEAVAMEGFSSRSVRQFEHPNGTFVKRDTSTGRILNVSDKPHKGVRNEK